MIIPIRCFTCGKPIAHLWDEFREGVDKGRNAKNLLDSLGLERYCCRSIFLTHIELIKQVGRFSK